MNHVPVDEKLAPLSPPERRASAPRAADEPPRSRVAGFRTKLLVAMMLMASAITALALYFAQRRLAASVADDLQRSFQAQLAAQNAQRDVRHAALVERCRALVRKPRIQGALEEALDLLYLNAEDELRDVMARRSDPAPERGRYALQSHFYRFLDRTGAVIAPPDPRAVGDLRKKEEAQLALPIAPAQQQIGYLVREGADGAAAVSEVITMPIVSTETSEVIAALALGFEPFEFRDDDTFSGMRSGIWVDRRVYSSSLGAGAQAALAGYFSSGAIGVSRPDRSQPIALEGVPHLLFVQRLNPNSVYPPAYELCVYPLTALMARQRDVRWQVLGAGALLLLLGLGVSHVIAGRFSVPVEELAVDSEENRAQRKRAEAALETTSAELQRSMRFSADASHQLKTPVTVLRAGLEELLARDNLTPAECQEVSALIHQTYRLSSLVDDLLLLSRMDAGRLKLELAPVNLTQLIEASLDDLSALPDDLGIEVQTDFLPALHIAGEKRYTAIILQNLLENARKYNRRGGCIWIGAHVENDAVVLTIANNGNPISAAAREHIFERFHRGVMGENVPGYGLGLNLARELARLHQGNLRLVRSDAKWTEFEVTFRRAEPDSVPPIA